jgi:hypothetical protein
LLDRHAIIRRKSQITLSAMSRKTGDEDEQDTGWRVALPFRADGGADFTHAHATGDPVTALLEVVDGMRVALCPHCGATVPVDAD